MGFNLDIDRTKGSLPESSVSITVKGHPCTSLRVVENQLSSSGLILPSYVSTLNCIVYSLGSNSTIDPSEVVATVLEGVGVSTSGSQSDIQPFVSIEYLDAIKAGSGGRPSLLSVEILALPFSPQALFFLKSSDSNRGAPKYLYWTNKDILTGSGTVYRCLLNGERIETVFESEQQKPGAIFVLSVLMSDLLIATSRDRAFELLDALSITASGGRNTTRETAAEATTLFTDIIFFTRSTVSQDGTPSVLSYAVVTPLDPTEALYSNKGSLNRNSTRPALISISKTVAVYLPQSAASTTSVPTALSVDRSLTNG